jgi:formamidopyrimidine-DNA glycosylase
MPELPEAEANRRHIEAEALNRTIEAVELGEVRHLDVPGSNALRRLEGLRFTQARRHGKAIFAGSASGPWIAVHLGMTGRLVAWDEGDRPKNPKVTFVFEGQRRLTFLNTRKLGSLEIVEDPDTHVAERALGPDALGIAKDDFAERVCSGVGAIKSALMDQKKVAGIGNIWSDEILFHAGLSPGAKHLSAEAAATLHDCTVGLLNRGVEVNAEYGRLPQDWLLHHREDGADCPRCGGTIRKTTVGGRAAHHCDTHQKAA